MKKIFLDEKELLESYGVAMYYYKTVKWPIRMIRAMKQLLSCKSYSITGEQHEVLFFCKQTRKDYALLQGKVFEQCPYDKGYLEWNAKTGFSAQALRYFFYYLPHIYEIYKMKIPTPPQVCETHKPDKVGFFVAWLVYVYQIKNMLIREAIQKYDWGTTKILVVFMDAKDQNNTVVKEAKKHGVKTVVFQHAVIFDKIDYKDHITLMFHKMPSEFLFAWGQKTQDVVKVQSPHVNAIICGNPTIEPILQETDDNIIGIACDFPARRAINAQMIQIIERYALKYGKQVRVRLHPFDAKEYYEVNESVVSFESDLDSAKAIVASSTTMILTYLAQGKALYRFTAVDFFPLSQQLEFSDFEEFEEKILQVNEIDFQAISKEYIAAIGDEAAEKYKNAFQYIYEL